MPWGVAAAVGGSVVGGLVNNAMAPSSSGGGPNYYTPTGLQGADQNWQNLLGGISGIYGSNNLNQYGQQSLQAGLNANNQYSPGYQAGANTAGQMYSNFGNLLNNQSQGNFGTQNQLLNAGQQVYQMGQDPQNALYNRTLQQVTDQSNAINSMYGLGTSAAGAGMTNQALSNFNIDWQNNELSRALQGLQGYTGAANTAGRYGELGTSQGAAAPGYALQGGQIPYQTAQGIAATPGQLGGQYGSYLNQNVYGPAEGMMSSIIPYMNYGAGAQSVPYQNATNNANQWGGATGSGVSSALNNSGVQNWLGNAFGGGGSSSFGGSDSGIWNSGGGWTGNSGYSSNALSFGF